MSPPRYQRHVFGLSVRLYTPDLVNAISETPPPPPLEHTEWGRIRNPIFSGKVFFFLGRLSSFPEQLPRENGCTDEI